MSRVLLGDVLLDVLRACDDSVLFHCEGLPQASACVFAAKELEPERGGKPVSGDEPAGLSVIFSEVGARWQRTVGDKLVIVRGSSIASVRRPDRHHSRRTERVRHGSVRIGRSGLPEREATLASVQVRRCLFLACVSARRRERLVGDVAGGLTGVTPRYASQVRDAASPTTSSVCSRRIPETRLG